MEPATPPTTSTDDPARWGDAKATAVAIGCIAVPLIIVGGIIYLIYSFVVGGWRCGLATVLLLFVVIAFVSSIRCMIDRILAAGSVEEVRADPIVRNKAEELPELPPFADRSDWAWAIGRQYVIDVLEIKKRGFLLRFLDPDVLLDEQLIGMPK